MILKGKTGLGLALLLLLAASCSRRDGALQFDSSDPLATQPGVEWAVVSVPYTACYAACDYASAVSTHYRRGAVLQVEGEQTLFLEGSERREKWYAFAEGWLPESAVEIYSNKLRAESASRLLLAQ